MPVRNLIKRLTNTYKDMSLPVKASLWFVICNILQKGISIITVPIFTRIMSPEQYGLYSIYTSWETIVVIFITVRVPYVAYNNGLVKFDKDIHRLTSSFQGLTTAITGAAFALYLIFAKLINHFTGMNTIIISLMFLQMLVQPAFELWTARQRFEYKYRKMTAMTMGIAVLNPVLGVIGVYLSTDKVLARIATMVFVQVVFCGSIYILNAIKGRAFYSKFYWKYALAMSLPLLPHYLSTTIMNQIDRIMIQKMCGLSDAAIYGVSHSAAYLVTLFTSAINNSIMPWTYQQLKAKNYKALYEKVYLVILIVGVIILIVIAFGPEIISVLATDEYQAAIQVIPPLAGALLFSFMYQVFGNIEFFYEHKKPSLYVALSATIINVILNYIFIGLFGFLAAGYTTLVSYIYFAFLHYIVIRRIIKKEIGEVKVYNFKVIMLISIVFMALLFIFIISYSSQMIRYALVLVNICVFIAARNRILGFIREIKTKA